MTCCDASLVKRLLKELADIQANCPEGIRITMNEQNLTEIQAEIDGPASTPYEGGVFRLKLSIPREYPSVPPKGFFTTKIFHPNVSTAGEICVNVLKKDWTPDMGIKHVLVVIKCLLVHTNPESALNEEAGRLLLENYDEFARHAKLMTSIHAHRRPGPLTASGISNTQRTATDGSQQATDKQQAASPPAAKKAKAEQPSSTVTGTTNAGSKPAAAAAGKVKKSLKRL